MSAMVAQLWCPRCQEEVVARIQDSDERRARCPWCDAPLTVDQADDA